MSLIPKLVEKLQRHPKRVVFPEGHDPRALQAARQWVSRRMGAPILLGKRPAIKEIAQRLDINTQGMRIIDPETSEENGPFVRQLLELRRSFGMTEAQAKIAVSNPNYFASLMVINAQADAVVGGATLQASRLLGPLFEVIPRQDIVKTASSVMVIDFDEKKFGSDGALFLADVGIVPEPTVEQLADIAWSAARVAHHLTNEIPRVAFLSWSTLAESPHPTALRLRQARDLAQTRAHALGVTAYFEAELQADAALDLAIAHAKGAKGAVAGRANVLIFPDLASGNIAAKLVHALSGANGYGQIVTGLRRPAAQISHGASAHDVFGAATILGAQAIDRQLLFGPY